MYLNGTRSKVLAFFVLLLLVSVNLTLIASSGADQNNTDGWWLDAFDDLSSISQNEGCVLVDGSIQLEKGIVMSTYDFSGGGSHQAWDANVSSIFGEDEQLIRMRNLLGQRPLSSYTAIASNDGTVFETRARSVHIEPLNVIYTFSPVHHFRMKITQSKHNLDYFTFAWWHGPKKSGANVESFHLYVWNYSALFGVGTWDHKGSLSSYAAIGSDPNGDIKLTSTNNAYINAEGYIDFLIVALPDPDEYGEPCILRTDYIQLTVKNKFGYLEDGYVISETIKPSSVGRWENILWSSSRVTDTTDVTIQVLTKSGSLIDEDKLPGNAEGFTSGLINVRSLNSVDEIKLKATLHSNDLSFTPTLHSWAATWQTESNVFKDLFTSDLRLEQVTGATRSGGQIKISSSSGGWPVTGLTSANTRSYPGYGPADDELYWYTAEESVGGGLRSPVVDDDMLFIASSVDGKIHAFNAKVSSSQQGDELTPAYNSSGTYVVDSSLAVAGDMVIVATSELNASNKIYALDKTTLDEVWSYTYTSGDICFSSAPVVSEGKVFITSWNGQAWETPLLSFLYEFQLIQGNNKIIALNLADGTERWTADLPAGSFSTPAVADGMVVVGCDKSSGKSLFAYDEDTGIKVWDTTVGLVGGASPVIYNDKVFVVGKAQSLLSLRGNINLYALDQYDGSLIWNQTVAEKIPAYEELPKGLRLYNLIATSTPAILDNKLFVTSPDGTLHAFRVGDGHKLWETEVSSAMYGIIPTYSCTSPVATYDTVYVASPNGVVTAVSTSGKARWEGTCKINEEDPFTPVGVLASPIVVDGVLYVSVTEGVVNDPASLSGRLVAFGTDVSNLRAKVVSAPIATPVDRWWESFSASVYTTTESDITFSILDEDYNVLLSDVEDDDDLADITTNTIRLLADLSRDDDDQHPALKEWSISFKNNPPPVFDEDSFIPDKSGWINTNTPVCSIKAYDSMPGLNIESAQYKITYLSTTNKQETTEWIAANCTGIVGSKTNETVTANISSLNISKDIKQLKTIEIYIEDLAGNTAIFAPEDDFKMDTKKPSSSLYDTESFSAKYHEPVVITANASDTGTNQSGVKTVGLYYRMNGGDWMLYEAVSLPYSWLFSSDLSTTYEFCTAATDRAGNVEALPTAGELEFLYDHKKPNEPVFGNESLYRFSDVPQFSGDRSISFSDDYSLQTIEYRLNFHSINNWTLVEDDINSKTYKKSWELTQDDFDVMIEDEEYLLYFKVTDVAGNEYISTEEEALIIIKDLTASSSYLDLSDFEEFHWDQSFSISADVSDDDVELVGLYYRYSSNNQDWSAWQQYGGDRLHAPFTWDFVAEEGSGYYQFKTMVEDTAGNVGESAPELVEVTLFPMVQLIVAVVLAMILLIVSVYCITAIRKKTT